MKKTYIIQIALLMALTIFVSSCTTTATTTVNTQKNEQTEATKEQPVKNQDNMNDSERPPMNDDENGGMPSMESGEGMGKMGAPLEAIAACKDQEEGDTCSFDMDRGEMEGICTIDANVLACMPENMQR